MKDAGYVCQLEKGRSLSALLLDSCLSQWWIELQLFHQLHKEQGSLASYSRASMAAVTKTNQETNLAVSALQAPHWESEKVASLTNSVLWNSFTAPKLHTSGHSCSKTLQEEDTWNPALGASTLYIIKTTGNKLTAAACFKFLPTATLLPSYCNSWIKEGFTLFWRQKSDSITWKMVIRNTVSSLFQQCQDYSSAQTTQWRSASSSNSICSLIWIKLWVKETIFLMKPKISQAPKRRPPNFR